MLCFNVDQIEFLREQREVAVFFKVALCWGLSFQENESIPWVYPIDRWVGEDSENWILRVHDIALATARKERRWAWIKTTTT